MGRSVKPGLSSRSPLAAARAPLDRLVRRDWIWRGRIRIDGLYCPEDGAEARRRALAPWLDRAEQVLEAEDGAALIFAEPVAVDCGALGRALPLVAEHGALLALPVAPPSEPEILEAIRGRILLTQGGALEARPLSAHRVADLGDWLDLSGVRAEAAVAPPVTPGAAPLRALAIEAGAPLLAPDARNAGFERLGPALDRAGRQADRRRFRARLLWTGIGVAALWLLLARGEQISEAAGGIFDDVALLSQILVSILLMVGTAALVGLTSRVLAKLAGGVRRGPGVGASRPTPPAAPSPPRAPSRLWRALGDLLRMTPLSGLALDRYDRRVAELKRLFAEGRFDEALKKGLSIGEESEPDDQFHADAPLSGPHIRKDLSIPVRAPAVRRMATLPFGAQQELRALYKQKAEELEAAGDFERAAFIHVELLGDPEAAVRLFERAERFTVAARLAQGRRLSPTLFVPLWYRAGEHELALGLAARHDAYEALLNAIAPKDADLRSELIRVWSERLAEVGAYAKALALTQEDATEDEALAARRRDWMARGLGDGSIEPEILARALKALPAPPPTQADGRRAPPLTGDPAMAALEAMMAKPGLEAARARERVGELLMAPPFEPAAHADFRRRLAVIAERLPRRMAEDRAAHGLYPSLAPLRALAEAGGQRALAADLRRIPAPAAAPEPALSTWVLLGDRLGAEAVRAATPMAGRRWLVAYESGRIASLDAAGRPLWRDQVWGFRDLIAIEPGRLALLIRDEPTGRRLSVLDTEARRHVEIGPLPLEAWCETASASGWLVVLDGQVVYLDLAPLVGALRDGPPARLSQHWAVPISVEGRVGALIDDVRGKAAFWLLARPNLLVERWAIDKTSLAVDYYLLRPNEAVPSAAVSVRHADFAWYDLEKRGSRSVRTTLSRPTEQNIRAELEAFVKLPEALHTPATDGARKASVYPAALAGQTRPGVYVLDAPSRAQRLALEFEGAGRGWMRSLESVSGLAVWDDQGRFAALDTAKLEIAFTNAATERTDWPR